MQNREGTNGNVEKKCTGTKGLKLAMLRNSLADETSLADMESDVDRSESASQPGWQQQQL